MHIETEFMSYVNQMSVRYRDFLAASFIPIARGGLSTDILILTCYADYTIGKYLLGSGPSTLTVAYDHIVEARSYDLYSRSHAAGEFGSPTLTPLMTQAEYESSLERLVWNTESELADIVEGREGAVFLAPMGAHNAIAVEAWQAVAQWDIQRVEDGTVAVRYGAGVGDPEHTQALASLSARITAAVNATSTATSTIQARLADIGGLEQYYRDMGAYGDITPDDGSTATFTPAQPPPVPTCSGVPAVSAPRLNPGLVSDCTVLLDSIATLAGTATLDWNASTTISTWEGVTLNASSTRVTGLDLDNETLDGTIPAALGELSALETLDLSDNDLTGAIPAELGRLWDLQELRLSGNSLTGCIPLELRSVPTNDLGSLGLPYCEPPAPENLSAGTPGETSIALSWDAVSGAARYRVEHRSATSTEWTVHDDTIAVTTHTVDGLSCGIEYGLRVHSYGDGTTYETAWSLPSAVVMETTGECVPPVFDALVYNFSVREDAATSTLVGTVSATSTGGSVTYAILSGNEDDKFAMGSSSGEVTVAGALDHETVPSYRLTVEARDARGGTATSTVEIAVTDVADDPPPAPKGLNVSLTDGTFTITWGAVPGADLYEAQHRTGGSGGDWASVGTTTATLLAYTPACATTHEVRVRAHGDGLTYAAVWGAPSAASETTRECPGPEFSAATYNFSVSEDIRSGRLVGRVSATDPEGGPVTYAITSGNERGDFAIGAGTGEITVAVHYLNHETVSSYRLTVEARDDSGGTATAVVEISVTDVRNELSPSPPGFSVSLVEGGFSMTWEAVPGAVEYAVQYRIPGVQEGQTDLPFTGDTSLEWLPAGGVLCETVYEFRAFSYGDGTSYIAAWGRPPAEVTSVTTGICNEDPEFGKSVYTFSIAENAATSTAVGTVSATDPDAGDTVTYLITSGNELGDFAIGEITGEITVADALDHETVPSYTLTVEASDDRGGTATATVEIAVTDVAEDAPPAPQGLGVSLADGTFSISWDAVMGAGQYEAQYRIVGSGDDWARVATTTSASLTFTPAGGPDCGSTYEFRVRAYGDGTVYIAAWGSESAPESVTTSPCNRDPVFGTSTYSFLIAENAATSTAVGTVSATDPDAGDTVTYSITPVNGDGKFAIGDSTGEITVAGALDHETVPSYKLTVGASDGRGGTATATVEIGVTDVAEDTPPAPQGLGVSLADGTFSISWDAVIGAGQYEAQYRIVGSGDDWARVAITTSAPLTFTPAGGSDCGSTYEFRVRAYGDGTVYIAGWGSESAPESVTTGPCNRDPVFGTSTYSFLIAENAATSTAVGTVSATDPDDDMVSYGITAGNGDGKFAIDDSTGEITVAGALDHETDPSYTLTVEARDNRGGAATTAVRITVTDVAETPPSAPQNLTATSTSASVTLTWEAPGESIVTGYQILRKKLGEQDLAVHVEDTGSTVTTYVDTTDIEAATTYVYRVKAINAAGVGAWSNYVRVTTVPEDTPTAPQGLSVSLANGEFSITWTALTGAARYEVQHRISGSNEEWAVVEATDGTSSTYSPAGGPACGTTYEFRVRAYGDGTVYVAGWGAQSDAVSVTTGACNRDPEFDPDSYDFSVSEDASVGDSVGTVSATDPDSGDTVSYSFTGANGDGKFVIGDGTGEITVAEALDHEAVPSYTLTVEASDGNGGSATTTVEIRVTDVAEDPPTSPQGLSVSLADETFSITWTALIGAGMYEVRHRIGGSGDDWASAATTTITTLAFSPAGGPACGTTYEFRVRAYGDGTTYAPVWGAESTTESVATGACNRDPEFGALVYSFSVASNAATSTAVGIVSATDADEGDTVSYSITGGNEDGKFAIGASTGRITVAGALDPNAVAFYALTVEASDGSGGTTTAAVGISLILAECSNGTVVPLPDDNPGLVRDCSLLLSAKDALAGEGSLNWSADTALRSWQGVWLRSSPSPHVNTLLLTRLGLTGIIPAALGGLEGLQRLDLDYNMLTGEIPLELTRLSKLESLYLQGNLLSGMIPPELSRLSNLKNLHLQGNLLSGTIPPELGELKELRQLVLDGNLLTGGIPQQLGDMTRLEHLYLRDNLLTGEIPSELEGLSNLTYLQLDGNGFTGCIPPGLRDVQNNDLNLLALGYCSSPAP